MMTQRTLLALALLLPMSAPALAAGPEDSVVRVFASLRLPNPVRPWSKQNPVEVMGTGVVIDGKTVLTNAHIVLYAGEVFVQAPRGGDRMAAKVASIGPGIDLATLTLEDETFFEKRPPIPRATKRPAANDAVLLMGFPVGGSGLSVSRGVVSRIDYAPYNDLTQGLRIQVDAVAGPGNSDGPVLVDGKMIGGTRRPVGCAYSALARLRSGTDPGSFMDICLLLHDRNKKIRAAAIDRIFSRLIGAQTPKEAMMPPA
jgi:S1-C subfamily serine protease